jgi:hypothetical protein
MFDNLCGFQNLEGLYLYVASPEAAVDLVQRFETQDNSDLQSFKPLVFRISYFQCFSTAILTSASNTGRCLWKR